MADTLEISLDSILTQIDERFEVIVVDGGSNDGSLEILEEMKDRYKNLRVIVSERSNTLGQDRHISIKNAKGKYVLPQLDMDDYYHRGTIKDVVKIFHKIESKLNYDFFLGMGKIAIGKRSLLLEVGSYRDLPAGAEDKDLWRRLLARDRLISIKTNGNLCKEIEGGNTFTKSIRRIFKRILGELRAGVTAKSYYRWSLKNIFRRPITNLIYWVFLPLAQLYLAIIGRTKLETPERFTAKGELEERMNAIKLSELERELEINVKRSNLSARTRKIIT